MQILYYSKNKQSSHRLSELLQPMGIEVTLIQQDQGNSTINDFIMHTSLKQESCMLPAIDVMIFYELSDEQISKIITLLKQHEIAVSYKCVVTKHNRSWRLIDLFQELKKEQIYFNTYERLHHCVAEVSEFNESDYSEASWKHYEAAFMSGYFCLQKQSSLAELEAAIQAINDAKALLSEKNPHQ